MTGARSNGARKSMRAIPLTQRQRKQGASGGKAHQRGQSAAPQGKRAHDQRGGRPVLISSAPPATPSARPSASLDLNAESDASLAPAPAKAPAKKKTPDHKAKRSAPPTVETRPMVMTPAPKTDALPDAPLDAAAPRRVKVRVRRKRPEPALLGAVPERAMELAETATLPGVRTALPTARSRAVLESETTQLSPDVTEGLLSETPGADAHAPSLDDTSNTSEPRIATVEEAAPGDAPAGPAEVAPEPRQPVTTRKLPTLAVMAALAPRAEARVDSDALEEVEAQEAPGGPETQDAPEAEETPASRPEPSDRPSSSVDWMLGEGAQGPIEPIAAPTPEPGASVTRPRARRGSPVSQPIAPTPVSQPVSQPITPATSATPDEPSGSGRRRMWWLNWPQAATEARAGYPSQDQAQVQDVGTDEPDGRDEIADGQDARQAHLPEVAHRAPIAPLAASAPTQPRPRPVAPPVALPPAPLIARSTPRLPDHWREAARGISQPRRVAPSDGRVRPTDRHEAERAPLFVWVGGAQAVLCGTAALVAALALLNGTAGERAQTVFAWAMAFALIAGAGAGLGHLAWQMKRAWLAPLALIISQLGLLAWALALLGARPALMAVAPFTVALTLRGLGRWVAALAALAALALYAAALALNLTGAWTPTVTFADGSAAALDMTALLAGMALTALGLMSLYAVGERERARTRAIERAARLAALELDELRAQTEDDADALRRALSAALRGAPTEGVRAEGALSPLAEQVSVVADRLMDLSHDREERKRLESATRRLTRNIERAWLGLSWSWPEASGVILDDLVALLRTPPHGESSQLPEDAAPTGQVVAPHLYRAWQPGDSIPSQPLSPLTPQPSLWPDRAAPSQPSGVWPSLWPSDPEPGPPGTDPLALPPSPRWRGPDDERRPSNSPSSNPWPGASNGSWPPGWSHTGY